MGIYLKAPAAKGGEQVFGTILYRLDLSPFTSYVGMESDFDEYEPLDLELVVRPQQETK